MNNKQIEEYRNTFTEEQISEIVKLYDSGEKVTNIISTYDLEISPGQIGRFLPMFETDKECIYCGKRMVRPRTRDSYTSKNRIKCKLCGHSLSKKCECLNCRKEMEKQELVKKNIIEKYYGNIILQYEEREFSSLNLEEKYFLYMLYRLDRNSISLKKIMNDSRENETRYKLIRRLLEKRVIFVSPDSDIEAFSEDGFPRTFYLDRVNYMVNVRITEEEERMIRMGEFNLDNIDKEEINELLHKMMFDDILEYFEDVLADRNIELKATEKQKKDLELLLTKLSYTQIKYLCLRVAKHYCDGIATHKFYRGKAGSQVMASVVTFYNNCILREWPIYKSDVLYTSFLLKYFITNVLQLDISILDEVIELKDNISDFE